MGRGGRRSFARPDAASRCGAVSRPPARVDAQEERDTMQRGRHLNLAALAGALALAAGVASAAPPPAATLPPGWTDVTVGKAGAKNAGSTVVTGTDLAAPTAVWSMTGVGDDV